MTTSQKVTKLCYTEETRNLNYAIRCDNKADLMACVELIDSYNYFDAKKINAVLLDLDEGEDKYTYAIGREGSPAIYIGFAGFMDGSDRKRFEGNMDKLNKLLQPDEYSHNEGIYSATRFWWD